MPGLRPGFPEHLITEEPPRAPRANAAPVELALRVINTEGNCTAGALSGRNQLYKQQTTTSGPHNKPGTHDHTYRTVYTRSSSWHPKLARTKPGAKSCRQPPFIERAPARWPRGCDPNTTLGVECLWGGRGQPPACSPTTAPRQPRRQPHYSPVFDGVFLIDGVGEGGKGERALARGPTMPLSRKET